MKKKYMICFIILFVWLGFIFIMSNTSSSESTRQTKSLINNIVNTTNKINIIDNIDINTATKKLFTPIRKIAHITEFFILSIIVIILLKNKIIDYNKLLLISMSICFIFACIDEYHQTFIPGRSGQFSDVLIDMIGVIFACILFRIYNIKREV